MSKPQLFYGTSSISACIDTDCTAVNEKGDLAKWREREKKSLGRLYERQRGYT
jgi:hypothetical protein